MLRQSTPSLIKRFFKHWIALRQEKEQLELLSFYDLTTHIPLYYRTLEGKIADITSIRNTVFNLKSNGMDPKQVIFVMDKDYYIDANIRQLLKQSCCFICVLDIRRNSFVTEAICKHCPSIVLAGDYIQDRDMHCIRTIHRIDIPREGRGGNSMNHLVSDICFNPERANRKQKLFSRKLARSCLKRVLFLTTTVFFSAVEKKVYGRRKTTVFTVNKKEEKLEHSQCGYFAYISDGSVDKIDVANTYAQRMMIECSFKNFKERYNRPMHSDD